MRRHLIMGCDSKVNIFCRYWVWAAISFKLYAIQQQWLHAYNYGQSTGRGLSARSFGYAWLMHIISAVAELLLTSFPCNMVMMYSNHEASVCLSVWDKRENATPPGKMVGTSTNLHTTVGTHPKLCWGSRSNSKVTWYGLLRVFTKNATPTMNLCSPNTHTMVCKPHKFVNPVNF